MKEYEIVLRLQERPSFDEYFSAISSVVATRSTCARRAVGAVLVDRHHRIIGTGYNGNARGLPHCIDEACPGASAPSGTGLDSCEAIHAEANALVNCENHLAIDTVYVTASPCVSCTKLLMNTSCKRIVYLDEYPNNGRHLWEGKLHREWVRFESRSL